jgi:DNA polymerase I-like protein with 3'-5' exonuclease and polymerase domains
LVVDRETSTVKINGKWDPRPYVVDKDNWDQPQAFATGTQEITCLIDVRTRKLAWLAERVQTAYHGVPGLDYGPSKKDLEGHVVVGHNIKFDAQHTDTLRECQVWDTMVAEYILSAQRTKFASLNDLIAKYLPGTKPKDDLIGRYLAADTPPHKIPETELRDYLNNDVETTGKVFMRQWEAASEKQRALILVQSTVSLAYGDVELNGLWVDVEKTRKRSEEIDEKLKKIRDDMAAYWLGMGYPTNVVHALKATDSFMAPRALSTYFFGSPKSWELKVPLTEEERKLTPRRKFRSVEVKAGAGVADPIGGPAALGAREHATSPGLFTVDDNALQALAPHSEFAKSVREARGLTKIQSTYYDAWLKQLEFYADNCLHPKVHSTATDTGRTSSSVPNVQNIPNEARECIRSRFDEGVLLEADFKQLEVCGLAQLSKCPSLIKALKSGADIHYLSGQKVYGWTSPKEMTKDERRIVKTINFGLIYGGSAKGLAAQAGIKPELAQQLIDGFYSAFPGVKKWQDETFKRVLEKPDYVAVVPGTIGTQRAHWLLSETGRFYSFDLEPPPWGGAERPKPTEVKNYPVQGFSTADVAPLAVMLVHKRLLELNDSVRGIEPVKLCAVVHDSMLVDCLDKSYAETVSHIIKDVVRIDLPQALRGLFGIEMLVPLNVDIEIKRYWSEEKTL